MNEPQLHVGILMDPQLIFTLLAPYRTDRKEVSGKQTATYHEGRILWQGMLYDELLFSPIHQAMDAFELADVTIGIHFHWERKENQRFLGALKIIVDNGKLTAINVVNVEDYLTCVISSEMSANASLELLKAHAVISRSWLLAQLHPVKGVLAPPAPTETDDETIRWYERDAHTRFDVCADDHCQRYQGITRATNVRAEQAVAATRGEVLTSNGNICDARYSKCCGGALEEFASCWGDENFPYLQKGRDCLTDAVLPDLRLEAEADRWIRNTPDACCHTHDEKVLCQVLNNYDQETTDFYRWTVEYSQDELSELVRQRSGIDYGVITDLLPVARGTSGRLTKLRIVGTRRTRVIGKELEIRRTLSPTHLYSSAFVVDKADGRFTLIGAGWGHGVGLCQIGAALMGEQGYPYTDILRHYYAGAKLTSLYT
ncbi:MAG: SpoIID/LytB domain-containing protein [Bacteroides sp.]